MQFSTAAIAIMGLALTVSAADEQLCFPVPGQINNVPPSITDLDVQIKINWATKLCAQIDYSTVDAQSVTTDVADGVDATENGKIYGLNLVCTAGYLAAVWIRTNVIQVTVAVPNEQKCIVSLTTTFMR